VNGEKERELELLRQRVKGYSKAYSKLKEEKNKEIKQISSKYIKLKGIHKESMNVSIYLMLDVS
jgi:uncharacterized membrane protein (DUF106 family)